MDVKLPVRIALCGGSLLALAWAPGRAAADDSSMVIVTATDAADSAADSAPAATAAPSELVFHIADDAPPTPAGGVERQADAARADLVVVANGARQAPVKATIVDADVVPAAHVEAHRSNGKNLGHAPVAGPRRPSPAAGIGGQRTPRRAAPHATPSRAGSAAPSQLPNDAPLAYDPADSAQPASTVSRLSPAPGSGALEKLKSPADHAKELLLNAYQLSLSANKEAEYSQIVQWCTSAGHAELDAESRQFGANLAAWALNRRGQCRADEGQTDLALADFRAALELAPENWRAMHNRGVTLAQEGQFAEAFDDVSRVIQLNPKFAKAFANRATLYVQANDLDHALADYDSALALDPELLPALLGRGRVCHMHGKLEDALPNFDVAVKLEPKDAEIVCSRADLLADLGRYQDALLDYAQAIDLNSKFEHAYRNGAWLLATCPDDSIRDVEGALAGAQAALDCAYGERHAALDTMAAALANAGRFDEAVGMVQQAIDVAPESVRSAYQARQQLYEAKQPFRSHPVAVETANVEPVDGAESAVYIEE